MAVVPVKEPSSVKIKFNKGTDLNGDVVYQTKTLSSIKATAVNEDIEAKLLKVFILTLPTYPRKNH